MANKIPGILFTADKEETGQTKRLLQEITESSLLIEKISEKTSRVSFVMVVEQSQIFTEYDPDDVKENQIFLSSESIGQISKINLQAPKTIIFESTGEPGELDIVEIRYTAAVPEGKVGGPGF